MPMKSKTILLAGFFLLGFSVYAQNDATAIKRVLNVYFQNWNTSYTAENERCKIDKINIDRNKRIIHVYGNELFAAQPFTVDNTTLIYKELKRLLPNDYHTYDLIVYGKDYPIEQLIPNAINGKHNKNKKWGNKEYDDQPWTKNMSHPYRITKGLQNRHFCVWASHGNYFKQATNRWQWQRPNLFCTNEDLLTQTIVVPYLIPMLENSGAVVFSPRERDWQKQEAIVDNDTPSQNGIYTERNNKYKWLRGGIGFAKTKTIYQDGENPFTDGSYQMTQTVNRKSQASEIIWQPNIPEKGQYAVYVSYASLANSIDDASYTVKHEGTETTVRVNQKMGGGTWVYLGSYEFTPDDPDNNQVRLTNFSEQKGIVTADAVRFGGGMGNIARGLPGNQPTTSGLPRFLEGARYNAQWAGMPDSVYNGRKGQNDYADDINTRSLMTNDLAGGSIYLPSEPGLQVPIELTLAVHSDAGVRRDNSFVGTLGIYTTNTNEGLLDAGLSRLTSRDLCDMVQTQVTQDIEKTYGVWKRRQMFDRNYSETRIPQIPSMILETLSHQNFTDMRMAHDPYFKFLMARAIYKGVLRYTAAHYDHSYEIQPLPVSNFASHLNLEDNKIELTWSPTADPLEPTALPDGYVVYTKTEGKGYDNGIYTKNTRFSIKVEKDKIYSFKITAVNDGGESFPSEELAAMISSKGKASVLIVNGFQRLAGPQPINTDSIQGFDLHSDPGIYYQKFPGYCGYQQNFNKVAMGKEGPNGLGYSDNELTGMIIAGNTFDYTTQHGKAIKTARNYSFASCSRSAVENRTINMNDYNVVDLILGLQKNDGYSSLQYKTFSLALQDAIKEYVRLHGNLFVSGAYVGTDMMGYDEQQFTQNTLKYFCSGKVDMRLINSLQGMNTEFTIYNKLNEKQYAVTWADCIMPTDEAFPVMLYNNQISAGIAYNGKNYKCMILGFPFESIQQESIKNKMMTGILNFLTGK